MQDSPLDWIDGCRLVHHIRSRIAGRIVSDGPAELPRMEISTTHIEVPIECGVDSIPLIAGGSVVLPSPDRKRKPSSKPCRPSFDVNFVLRLNRVIFHPRGDQARLIYDVQQIT